jgi:catechol 2,3-dioxygenase-like lactoylglutathione lyase family enzyme
MPLFSRIDTIVLPVRDWQAARDWYTSTLGFRVLFEDPREHIVVLATGPGVSLTLWQPDGDVTAAMACPFPVFSASNVSRQRRVLEERGVRTSAVVDAPGLRFFAFWDPDGNRIEACEIVTPET